MQAIDDLSQECGFPIVEDKQQVVGTILKRIGRLKKAMTALCDIRQSCELFRGAKSATPARGA